MSSPTLRIGVLGASGYTGADFIRLGLAHPNLAFTVLTANAHAGVPMRQVYPHLTSASLPDLIAVENADWSGVDALVCALPHATSQPLIAQVLDSHPAIKVVDMSADFRLRDVRAYADWYDQEHQAKTLQAEAVYGLSEHYRAQIAAARLVACPGCYPTATLLALIPPLKRALICGQDIIVDAKSGVSGAGRGLKQGALFCEAGEGMSAYAVGHHRHMAELDQELSLAADAPVLASFTPHLVPASRGELVTCYARLGEGAQVDDVRAALEDFYADAPFVHVLEEGVHPATSQVRGSNHTHINVFADRAPGRVILIAALDNLVKGSAGQALQNLNLMFGLHETTGLEQLPLFP